MPKVFSSWYQFRWWVLERLPYRLRWWWIDRLMYMVRPNTVYEVGQKYSNSDAYIFDRVVFLTSRNVSKQQLRVLIEYLASREVEATSGYIDRGIRYGAVKTSPKKAHNLADTPGVQNVELDRNTAKAWRHIRGENLSIYAVLKDLENVEHVVSKALPPHAVVVLNYGGKSGVTHTYKDVRTFKEPYD